METTDMGATKRDDVIQVIALRAARHKGVYSRLVMPLRCGTAYPFCLGDIMRPLVDLSCRGLAIISEPRSAPLKGLWRPLTLQLARSARIA